MSKSEDDDATITYDFSNISEETKNALALSHEAVKGHIDALPEQVGLFYKSAAKALDFSSEPELEKPDSDPDTTGDDADKTKVDPEAEASRVVELIKSALPGAIEVAIKPVETEFKKAQDRIAELEGLRDRDEITEIAASITPNGDKPSPELVDQLVTIKKSMSPEQWEKYLERERGTKIQLEKSALLERQSSPAALSANSAYGQLKGIADSLIEKSEVKDPTSAWDVACERNPALYDQYRAEQAATSKAGS